jgi:hypothetical protein
LRAGLGKLIGVQQAVHQQAQQGGVVGVEFLQVSALAQGYAAHGFLVCYRTQFDDGSAVGHYVAGDKASKNFAGGDRRTGSHGYLEPGLEENGLINAESHYRIL